MAALSDEFLQEKPALDELCEHIIIGSKWYQLGIQLKLNAKSLNSIQKEQGDDIYKTSRMFQLWLDTNPYATRRQVVEALKKEVIGEINIAKKYVEMLSRESTGNDSCNEANIILQHYSDMLSQSLIYPVKLSQHLFSERCISEATLDEVETLESSLDKKKTTLLSAIQEAITSDHRKLKLLATVLSKFEETKILSEKIVNDYIQKFPDDQMTAVKPHANSGHNNEINQKDHANEVLRCHYGSLSQSLQDPIPIARLLCTEKVISERILTSIEDQSRSLSEKRTVLLQSIRIAVNADHHNFEMFIGALLKFTENVPLANAIKADYRICTKEIFIPRSMRSEFNSIRTEFGTAFNKVRALIKESPPPLEELKMYLEDCFFHLKPELTHACCIDEVLSIVRNKCTLIDIGCLEALVKRFDITEATVHIKAYKEYIDKFCQSTYTNLCLDEKFEVADVSFSLQSETLTFVLDWNAEEHTLEDVRDILAESFKRYAKQVQIKVIKKVNSIAVICIFPLSLATLLIANAQETLELVKTKGLIRLNIGVCTIYDKHRQDEEVEVLKSELKMEIQQLNEEVEVLKSELKMEQTISKRKTLEIEEMRQKVKDSTLSSIAKKENKEDKVNKETQTDVFVTQNNSFDTKLSISHKDIGLQTNLTEGIDLTDTAEQIANTQSQQESLLITQDSMKLSKEDLEGHSKGSDELIQSSPSMKTPNEVFPVMTTPELPSYHSPLLFVAKYKCDICGEKWKVRNSTGGRKQCQGKNCPHSMLPYKKEIIDKLAIYQCPECKYVTKRKCCASEVSDVPYCRVCRLDMMLIESKNIKGPRRMFGEFFCDECDHKWYSGNAWEGKGQKCRKCGRILYPSNLCPLRPSSIYQAKEPHDQARCQMCQELGHNCKDYVPQDIDLSYEDDDKQSIITENSSVTKVSGVREESLIPPAIDSDQTPTENDPDTEDLITGAAQKLSDMMISDVSRAHNDSNM